MEVTLQTWARSKFEKQFSIRTLRAWATAGKIKPFPRKIGNTWLVDEDAQYVEETIEYKNTKTAKQRLKSLNLDPDKLCVDETVLRILDGKA